MILKTLHIEGFTSYIDSLINFNDSTVYTINAPNGFGKSSILEAITTALFYRARGTDTRGAGMDNLINNSCEEFIITLDFEMDNNNYTIIRKKIRNGKHELEFYINDINETEKIAETQTKINNIIKMNYETFLDTVCIGQGMSNNFMKKKPAERKEVFAEILNLNDYNVLEKYTKELKKDIVNQITINQAKIDVLEQTFAEKDTLIQQINNYKTQLTELNNAIQVKQKELNDVLKEKTQYELLQQQQLDILQHKNTIITNISNLKTKINNLKDKYTNICALFTQNQAKIKTLEETNKNIQLIQTNEIERNKLNYSTYIEEQQTLSTKLEKELTEINTKTNLNNQEIQELQNQYNSLLNYNSAICEFCGNQITDEHKQKHLTDLQNKINKIQQENHNLNNNNIQQQISEIKLNIEDVKVKIIECDKQIKQGNDNKLQFEQNKSEITILSNSLTTYTEQIEDIKVDNDNYNNELKELKLQLEKYKNIELLPNKTFNNDIIQNEINDIQQQINTINGSIQFNQNKLIEIQNNEEVFNTLNNTQKELNIKLIDYESLIDAFGKKGIQADIIANVLPDIENEINDVLKILFNSLTVEFTTQKESKSNTTLETLDIVIHDKGTDRYYETYSGGEKFRIDFAFHVGLSKFLAKRANANIQFFIVDEGLGSQDDEGKENFILIINKLRTLFNQIFIITHIEDIKDAFDRKITIYKDPIKGSIIK